MPMSKGEMLGAVLSSSSRFKRLCAERGGELRPGELEALCEELARLPDERCLHSMGWAHWRVEAEVPKELERWFWARERERVPRLVGELLDAISRDRHCSDEVVEAARRLRAAVPRG